MEKLNWKSSISTFNAEKEEHRYFQGGDTLVR